MKKTSNSILWAACLLCVLLVTGCRSHRHAERTQQVDTSTGATQRTSDDVYLPQGGKSDKSNKSDKSDKSEKSDKKNKKEQSQATNAKAVSAKMSLTLAAGSKQITCGGTYRLLRDDVIQFNLTYGVLFVSMNVGTLEITRD